MGWETRWSSLVIWVSSFLVSSDLCFVFLERVERLLFLSTGSF